MLYLKAAGKWSCSNRQSDDSSGGKVACTLFGQSLEEEPLISSTVYQWALSVIYRIEALFLRFLMMLFVLHKSWENESYRPMSRKKRGVLSSGIYGS